jgi:hypothetical protein
MPTSLELQGAVKLRKLMQVYLPRALESRELLKIFPLTKVDSTSLVYERRQMATGLQGARGIGGPTNPVRKPGMDQFRVAPGYYGDHYTITEQELVDLRDAGVWDNFESYDAQAARGAEHLTRRFLDRCENSVAQLLMTGSFTAPNAQGATLDQQIYNVPSFTPGTLFSDLSNSQPLNYIRDLIPTLELLVSVSFQKGFMLMSRPTVNLLLKNQNAADLNGRRLNYGNTVNNVEDFNDLLVSNDLPKAKVYDEGYYSDPPGSSPTKNRFLTNGKIVLVGVREDGEQIGEYRLTRAAQNERSAPGEWYQVDDRRAKDPCEVILRAGHNGGPIVFYTECTAVINAAAPF